MADYKWTSAHYIDNDLFYENMKKRKEEVEASINAGLPKPMVSNYIAECIMKIATHLSFKPNFNGYSFKSEMILDAIENCLKVVDRFNTEISNNPFWYFSSVSYNAFVRRILEERKHAYIKGKIISQMPFDAFDLAEQDEGNEYTNAFIEMLQEQGSELIRKEDLRLQKKKDKAKELKISALNVLFE